MFDESFSLDFQSFIIHPPNPVGEFSTAFNDDFAIGAPLTTLGFSDDFNEDFT